MNLNTIQKREKLNVVFDLDNKGNGGANHAYGIDRVIVLKGNEHCMRLQTVQMQDGPRGVEGSTDGVLDTDLLEIVRHRLQCFQAGPFASRENAVALTHVEEALMWFNRRVEDRIERNVLGTNNE